MTTNEMLYVAIVILFLVLSPALINTKTVYRIKKITYYSGDIKYLIQTRGFWYQWVNYRTYSNGSDDPVVLYDTETEVRNAINKIIKDQRDKELGYTIKRTEILPHPIKED